MIGVDRGSRAGKGRDEGRMRGRGDGRVWCGLASSRRSCKSNWAVLVDSQSSTRKSVRGLGGGGIPVESIPRGRQPPVQTHGQSAITSSKLTGARGERKDN